MRGTRGQHEQCFHTLATRTRLNVFEHPLAKTHALHRRIDRETGHFTHLFFFERIQRGTAENHIIVLKYAEKW